MRRIHQNINCGIWQRVYCDYKLCLDKNTCFIYRKVSQDKYFRMPLQYLKQLLGCAMLNNINMDMYGYEIFTPKHVHSTYLIIVHVLNIISLSYPRAKQFQSSYFIKVPVLDVINYIMPQLSLLCTQNLKRSPLSYVIFVMILFTALIQVKKEEEVSKQEKSAIDELYLNRLFTTKVRQGFSLGTSVHSVKSIIDVEDCLLSGFHLYILSSTFGLVNSLHSTKILLVLLP